jgi:hypothetical protein
MLSFSRFMLGLAAVPSIIMFFGCLALPESPRWLVKKKKMDQARKVLMKLSGKKNIEEEIQSVLKVCQEEEQRQKGKRLFILHIVPIVLFRPLI